MARPTKPRVFDGVVLPENLYEDARKRSDYWRYLKPDGKFKTFKAPLDEAIRLAKEANQLRDLPHHIEKALPARDSISYHAEKYIVWREEYDPTLAKKDSWVNRRNQIKAFAKEFANTSIKNITLHTLRSWWEGFSYHQQHNRRSEFNKLFNYFGGNGLTPQLASNPFTTMDDKPRLIERKKPTPKRLRLGIDQFWAIYRAAGEKGYEGLQIAMGISLVTSMRIGDICTIKFSENITETSLKKTINKSEEQRAAINAAHLEWNFNKHVLLHALVKRGRELSLKNMRCPYLVSHMPEQRRTGKTKDHFCQLTTDRLGKLFAEVRDSTKLFASIGENATPPTFHEIRALSSDRYRAMGYSTSEVKQVMAHTDERVTKGYQVGHSIEWTPIDISIEERVIKGKF